MPRNNGLTELAMEAQVAVRDCRRRCAPVYEAAFAARNHQALLEANELARTLRVAALQAKRLTGYADSVTTNPQLDIWEAIA